MLEGRAPHLDRGEGWTTDPAFYYTTLNGGFQPPVKNGVSEGPPTRAAWHSYTQSYGEGFPVALDYAALDPTAVYTLTVLFFATNFSHSGGGNGEINVLHAGGSVLQRPAPSPFPMRPVTFDVPHNETRGGALRVECRAAPLAPTAIPMSSRCSIVSVWLSVKIEGSVRAD